MNLYAHFAAVVGTALGELIETGVLPQDIDLSRVSVVSPRDAAFGDITTNAALVLAKSAGQTPRQLAGKLADLLVCDADIETVDVAGPGFINIRLTTTFWPKLAKAAFDLGEHYGCSNVGEGKKVNVEYFFVNPAAPLHIGHCRGAVFADALANLLQSTGYDVSRVYYIDYAGPQVDDLARSAFLHYRKALGEEIGKFPDGLYRGDYLKPVGSALAAEHGDALLSDLEADWLPPVREKSISVMMDVIRDDLAALNIDRNSFTFERTPHGKNGQGAQEVKVAVSGAIPRTEIRLCVVVNLSRGRELIENTNQVSKFTTFHDVVDEVGPDVVRFMMLYSEINAPLEFDFEKVTEQSRNNPVFMVQYTHARICSMLRNAALELGKSMTSVEKLSGCNFNLLDDAVEIAVMRKVGEYPRLVEAAAAQHEPYRLAIYLFELANEFHGLWNKGKESPQLRFIVKERMHVTLTRLAFLRVIRYVLGNGLRILGVNPVEEM